MELKLAKKYMQFAIEEGRKAREICSPNPPVGCILVGEKRILSRGYTNKPGAAHAEAMALSCLPNTKEVITAFVTLEPCSFVGRTPSCANSIINSTIKEVYVGIIDPDPRNNGKGIAMLEAAGINVHVGLLAEKIKSEIGSFLCSTT